MMLDSTRDVLFLSAKRTAFGALGGALVDLRATDFGRLQAITSAAHEIRSDDADVALVGCTESLSQYCSDRRIVVIGIVGGRRRQEKTPRPYGTHGP